MKKLILNTLLFALPILVLIICFEAFIRQRPSVFDAKRDYLMKEKDSIEVLILGNSHTSNGFAPAFFTKYAFNLAFQGQGFYFDEKLLEKYLPQMPKLQYVILSIDFGNLTIEHDSSRDFFYAKYFGIPYKGNNYPKERLLHTFYVYSPLTIWKIIRMDYKFKTIYITGEKGWAPELRSDTATLSNPSKVRLKAEEYNGHAEFTNYRVIKPEIDSIMKLLKAHNITPILVNCPVYKTMRNFLDAKMIQKTDSIARSIAREYDVLYLDYYNDDSFTMEEYVDPHHLNFNGSKRLTMRVDSIIENLDRK